jgi:hypothetical protein
MHGDEHCHRELMMVMPRCQKYINVNADNLAAQRTCLIRFFHNRPTDVDNVNAEATLEELAISTATAL